MAGEVKPDPGLVIMMEAFDKLDRAAQRVLVALPSQMTDAAAELDHARIGMRSAIQSFARDATRSALERKDTRP